MIEGPKSHIETLENQAIARAARLGNKKDVKIIKLITKNTIEEELWDA